MFGFQQTPQLPLMEFLMHIILEPRMVKKIHPEIIKILEQLIHLLFMLDQRELKVHGEEMLLELYFIWP